MGGVGGVVVDVSTLFFLQWLLGLGGAGGGSYGGVGEGGVVVYDSMGRSWERNASKTSDEETTAAHSVSKAGDPRY